mgnify:CR=1 FL=1
MKEEKPAEKADENVGPPDNRDYRNEGVGIVDSEKVEPVRCDEKNSYGKNDGAKLEPDLGGTSFWGEMQHEDENSLECRHVDVVEKLDG